MKATKNNLNKLTEAINNPTTPKAWRSAWARGVQFYAGMLLERFEEWREWNEANGEDVPELDEITALNGASNWSAWSYGGCGLVYDSAICAALCTESEQQRTANGAKQPNPRENWLDVEARAARQAWGLIAREVARLEA